MQGRRQVWSDGYRYHEVPGCGLSVATVEHINSPASQAAVSAAEVAAGIPENTWSAETVSLGTSVGGWS